MSTIHAYAAKAPKGPLQPFEFEPGELRQDQVEIKVTHCGICHSDLSMLDNEWGRSQFPLVPGHEAVGTVLALGEHAKGLAEARRLGAHVVHNTKRDGALKKIEGNAFRFCFTVFGDRSCLKDRHIRVNAVSPGSIDTPGLSDLLASSETGQQRLHYSIRANEPRCRRRDIKREPMTLMIEKSAQEEFVVFALSGRIEARRTAELQKLIDLETGSRSIVLDLKQIQLVDQDTVRFLMRCESDGIKLENCPAYIREWIAREGGKK